MDSRPRYAHLICGLLLGHLWLTSTFAQASPIYFERDPGPWVYSIAPDGSGLTAVAEGRSKLVSPDGRSLLVRRGGALAAVTINGGGMTALGDDVGSSPTWSADGQQVLFHRRGDIYLAKVDGSGEALLVSGGLKAWWAPTDPPTVYFNRRKLESMETYDVLAVRHATSP